MMKTKGFVAGVVAAGALAVAFVAGLPPNGPCVARRLGEPLGICRRAGLDVPHLVPFPASEGSAACRPIACDFKKDPKNPRNPEAMP